MEDKFSNLSKGILTGKANEVSLLVASWTLSGSNIKGTATSCTDNSKGGCTFTKHLTWLQKTYHKWYALVYLYIK